MKTIGLMRDTFAANIIVFFLMSMGATTTVRAGDIPFPDALLRSLLARQIRQFL